MFEKVNPAHPDKLADRIAGALVDLAYKNERAPRIAVEVLIGHGCCHIICETSTHLKKKDVKAAVYRIAGKLAVDYVEVPQDSLLSHNQAGKFRCGDNGIFRGVPLTPEQKRLSEIARDIYDAYPYDGKYILDTLEELYRKNKMTDFMVKSYDYCIGHEKEIRRHIQEAEKTF